MTVDLSVIMSVYNGDAYLREAVESILSQTYKVFEFKRTDCIDPLPSVFLKKQTDYET